MSGLRFKEGREDIQDNSLHSYPSTSKTDENVQNIGRTVWPDHHLSIGATGKISNLDKETVR